jgi:hypothetical protein
MKRSPEMIQSLPCVAAPSITSWRYFRARHLPTLVSTLAGAVVLWLWVENLREAISSDQPAIHAGRVEPITTVQKSVGVRTNCVALEVFAENLGLNHALADIE